MKRLRYWARWAPIVAVAAVIVAADRAVKRWDLRKQRREAHYG